MPRQQSRLAVIDVTTGGDEFTSAVDNRHRQLAPTFEFVEWCLRNIVYAFGRGEKGSRGHAQRVEDDL